MFALFSRILKLSDHYKSRIQGAFVCAFLESILSKMPIFLAFVVLSGFANKTITGQTCLYVGLGLVAIVLVQMFVHYLSDSLQSAAGYLMFADKRIELGGHLRKLPMGYFTSGNIGKISSVLSTDMVFIEEVAMSTLGNMMSYLLSSLVLLAFMFYLNWQLGLIALIVTILAWLVSKGMNKVSLREAAGRQEQSERLTDAVLSFVEGIGVIKSYNLLGEKSEELSGNFKRSRNTSLDFEQKMTPWTMGLNILYGIGIAAIFGLSIVLEQSGVLSLAYVLGVLLFVFDLFGPLKALYGEASRLTVMNAALDRIEAVLDEPELSDNGKQHIPAQAQPGQPEVQFNDVTFAYQDKEVLHHISFAMKKNSMTALVGPSGSGKSTIANLLARLWDIPYWIFRRMEEMEELFGWFLKNDKRYILFLQQDSRGHLTFMAVNREIPKYLDATLWSRGFPAILTSGTLKAGNGFARTRQMTGLEKETGVRECVAESPFCYKENCLLYIPEHLRPMKKGSREEAEQLAGQIRDLVCSTYGHTLVLFTSYTLMGNVHQLLRDQIPFPMVQVWRNSQEEIARFKKMENAVLFAAGSCWEGVDFPGDMVSSLIIVKLPFSVPDPIHEAQKEQYRSLESYIQTIVVPDMQKKLRQGFGRAIRTEQDTCVVSILDHRTAKKGRYRSDVLEALPKCQMAERIEEVENFIRSRKVERYYS